jgi:hypothetical protein
LTGEGESSIISTQPEESAGWGLGSSLMTSGRFFDLMVRPSSSAEDTADAEELAVAAEYEFTVEESGFGLLVTLPIRSLGTRVCILCSKFFTRALISETICTPLLLDVVLGTLSAFDAVVAEEMFRVLIGRGVLDGWRVGVGEK